MIKTNVILIVIILFLVSCNHGLNKRFDKASWLLNDDVNVIRNPRADMVADLLANHLKVGLTRNSVLALLGKPYQDGVENRLPKGLEIPDSLSLTNVENLKPENKDNATKKINEFMRKNVKPDTLMLYPVGWSTIDPNFLAVQFDNKGRVRDFWIEQH